MQPYEQGATDTTPANKPLHSNPREIAPNYNSDAQKVLATLWHYQQLYFENEPLRRWTFTVSPSAPDFPAYLRGIAELVTGGHVVIIPENNHCVLNNEGWEYCKSKSSALRAYSNIYRF